MWYILLVLFVVWVLLQRKTSRKDGTYLGGIHKYRRLMQFIMRTRAESIVYYDVYVKAEPMLDYIKQIRARFHADVTHCLVAATSYTLKKNPEMNRFTLGRRLYQRKGVWVTFSMKRKKLDKKSKLATVKKEIPADFSFEDLCRSVQSEIDLQRSEKKTYHDKEYDLLTAIPRPILNIGTRLIWWLDYNNILPYSFIEGDGMYTSAFLANLGSLKMKAAYHHLFEWGNCPVFIMAGQIEDRPVVRDGEVVVEKSLHMRITYDERIADGLTASHGIDAVRKVLEDPAHYLGCLAEDGSDQFPIGEPPEDETDSSDEAS